MMKSTANTRAIINTFYITSYLSILIISLTPSCILSFTIPSPTTSSIIKFASTTVSSSTKLQMSLEPLAKEGSWTAYLDEENTGLVYYFNSVTGESSWDPPTKTFPVVTLPKRMEIKMDSKRKEYNDKYSASVASSSAGNGNEGTSTAGGNRGGFFTSFFSPKSIDDNASANTSTNTSTDTSFTEAINEQSKQELPFFNLFGGINTGSAPTKEKTDDNDSVNDASDQAEAEGKSFFNVFNPVGGGRWQDKSSEDYTLFRNFFGQAPSKDATNGNTKTEITTNTVKDQELEEEEEEAEEEFYDQLLYEDAVIAEPEVAQPIKLEFASKVMPHPDKVSWGGEDALFVAGKSFGVFDGVSGAEKLEGVPLYSNTLAQKLKSTIGKDSLSIEEIKSYMLQAAEYADMAATGASTAVVASIGDDNILRAVNLGDSVLMVIRDGQIKARAKETIHYFDCPYQLSDESPDRPRNGSIMQTQLEKGDLIIAGSDGVFDNLGDSEVIEIVNKNNNASISKLVQQIVSESRRVSKDPNAATPYAKLAKRNNYAGFSTGVGGKLDDISCIVVRCK